jgi:site-specific DNA recombinase
MTARAAIYVRVSTEAQSREDNYSLGTQEEECGTYCAEHGYEVVEVYREVFSGTEYWGRPQLTRLRDDMRADAFGVVVIHAIDRLSRNQNHVGAFLTDAQLAGVVLESVKDKFEDTATGRFLVSAAAFAAEIEIERKREASVRGKKGRVASGKIHRHGIELYGYQRDKDAGTRTVVESEAIIVRRVFDALAASVPMRDIVRRLAVEGVPSPSGNPAWARSQLHRVARNPAYKGEAVAWRYKRVKKNGHVKAAIRDQSEWIPLPGTTPAIVSPELWQAVQRRLDANTGEATKNGARPYLLRGMAVCYVCGARMYSGTEKGVRVYRCSSREKGGACGGKRVNADALEAWAWTATAEILKEPSLVTIELRRRERGAPVDERQRSALTAHIAKVDRQQKTVTARMGEAEEPALARQLQERWAELQRERERLGAEVAAVDERAEQRALALQHLTSLKEYCARAAENLDAFGWGEKRSALEALDVRVIAGGPGEWRLQGRITLPTALVRAAADAVLSTASGRCARPPRRPPGRA